MARIEQITTEILTGGEQVNVLVTVTDGDGTIGVGEAWWGIPDRAEPGRSARPIASTIDDLLTPRAIGREANNIEAIWHDLWHWGQRYGDHGIFMMGLSGLDLALWDLKGRRLDVPVVDLLGGPALDSIPVYASLPALREPELLLRETTRAIDAGFAAVKLHEIDPELTALLRHQFGSDLVIMVDVNGQFDPAGAIAHGRRLSELDVLWFEEPVSPMRDERSIARVGDAIDCDLAGGENEYTLADFDRLLTTGALTYLQPEITKIGGLTGGKRVAALTERHNVALCPHNFRLGPSLYASIHWAFSSPASRWLEFPWMPDGVGSSYPVLLPEVDNGVVRPLPGPGFGCEPIS